MDKSQLAQLLDHLSAEISQVESELDEIFGENDLDGMASSLEPPRQAVPYALGAYSLASVLFAYLRSEGNDASIVNPELARIQSRLKKMS